MNPDKLITLVGQGESGWLEFTKTTGQLRAGMKTVCAFLNTNGGKILFGVNDKGEILGQTVSSKTLEDAAVALFGKNVGSQFPQCEIRLARFRGTDKQPDFADNRQHKDHAFGLLRRAEAFLLDHMPIAGALSPSSIIRRDTPCYPPRATREALANAICHRDYAIPGGTVAIAMFNNRLEIINPGECHFGLTADKMSLSHESRPWNPLIANAFYRAGIIERWGSGTTNMVHWCEENGNPVPEWQERNGSVIVSFYPPAGIKKGHEEKVTPQVTPPSYPPSYPPVENFPSVALNLFHEKSYNKLLRYKTVNIFVRPSFTLRWQLDLLN